RLGCHHALLRARDRSAVTPATNSGLRSVLRPSRENHTEHESEANGKNERTNCFGEMLSRHNRSPRW
ncbi:MAG: hypothetical protein WCI74_12345, partial [Actinomycetes bacterium]